MTNTNRPSEGSAPSASTSANALELLAGSRDSSRTLWEALNTPPP